MNFDIKWTRINYQKFLDYLYANSDAEYKKFHSKLTLENNLIGVRTPLLKKIAKEISKNDYAGFIRACKNKLYEEKTIHGLIIGYLKDFDEAITYLDKFFIYIDNWATCDLLCANLKIFKRNPEKGYDYIKKILESNNVWKIRTGLVLLNSFYVSDKYINEIFKLTDEIKHEQYYVKMAIAWLLSTCYIKYKEETYSYLLNNNLDIWVYNKTIQKIKESKRVGETEKNTLEKLKKTIKKNQS